MQVLCFFNPNSFIPGFILFAQAGVFFMAKKQARAKKDRRFPFWKWILGGIIFAVIAQLVHNLSAFFSMKFYLMPEYFSVWSKLMIPDAGPPPASFMWYALLFSFVAGLIFVFAYLFVKSSISVSGAVKKGFSYGCLVFLVGIVPFSLSLYLLINLPSALIWIWALESLIVYLINGMIVAALFK